TSSSHLTLPSPIYSPGMRTLSTSSLVTVGTNAVRSSTDSNIPIQLQDFDSDGMPPAPPVQLSWTRIARWAEYSYPELYDNIQGPAEMESLTLLERSIENALPPDVRASFLIHDGQDISGKPCGLIYGITLLEAEEALQEWSLWRNVALKIDERRDIPSTSAMAGRPARYSFIANQTSMPEDAIQPVYAHMGWLPLAKDFSGNNIAVDLAPGPSGHWGQVILFGRDFDRKYVIARSWGHFLAMLADDFESGRWSLDEDSEELWYVNHGKMSYYFDVLRRRVERNMVLRAKQAQQAAANATTKQRPEPTRLNSSSSANLATLRGIPSSSSLKYDGKANTSTGSLQHLLSSGGPASPVVSARLTRTES
ncbi:hypothetical protein V1511DRAFT_448444, partial [Dipodascopsis uninucleata]